MFCGLHMKQPTRQITLYVVSIRDFRFEFPAAVQATIHVRDERTDGNR